MAIKHDNCKDCHSRCIHAGKDRDFICMNGVSCKIEKEKPKTNADRIRAMSDEELAKEILFFCPTDTVFKGEDTYGKPHYTGLDGRYYATSEEVVASNLEWLQQPAD